MAVFFRAYMLYTILDGVYLLEKWQWMTQPTDLRENSLHSNWKYHRPHFVDEGPAALHTHGLGSVDDAPGACVPGLHLVGLATHALVAQVGDDGIAVTCDSRLGRAPQTSI